MNGNTKLKLQGGIMGGIVGAVVALLIAFASFSYSYGQLNTRVEENEKKVGIVSSIDKRLARVETILERIERKL